jgi:hypothetical protein
MRHHQPSSPRLHPGVVWPVAVDGSVRLIVRIGFAISAMSSPFRVTPRTFTPWRRTSPTARGFGVDKLRATPLGAGRHRRSFQWSWRSTCLSRSIDPQRTVLSVVASSAILIMGLLGRKLAAPVVGITAAAIVAIDSLWFRSSGIPTLETTRIPALVGGRRAYLTVKGIRRLVVRSVITTGLDCAALSMSAMIPSTS